MLLKQISRIVFVGFLLMLNVSKSVAKGGTLSWLSASDSAIHVLKINTGFHTVLRANHIDTLSPFQLDYPVGSLDGTKAGHVFWSHGAFWGVFDGFGAVLKVDTAKRTVSRHDRTTHSGYNFDAYQFQRNDTLYSFGGYGFWMKNNLLTFYSKTRREWNKYTEAPFTVSTPTSLAYHGVFFYDKKSDKLYVTHQNIIYVYDFRRRSWSTMGYFNEEVELNNLTMQHRLSDTTMLIMGNKSAWMLHFEENQAYDVTMANQVNVATYRKLPELRCAYALNEQTLIMPRISNLLDQGYVLEYAPLPMTSNQAPLKITTKFSSTQEVWLLGTGLGVLLLGGGLLVRRSLGSRKKVDRSPFNPKQHKVVEALMKSELTTDVLNNLLEMEAKSWEVQRRERSILVKELNQIGGELLSADIVLRQKAKHDKRQVEYVLNEAVRVDLARLML